MRLLVALPLTTLFNYRGRAHGGGVCGACVSLVGSLVGLGYLLQHRKAFKSPGASLKTTSDEP